MKILEDFINIYNKFDINNLSKIQDENLKTELNNWFKTDFLEIQSAAEILDFTSEHNVIMDDIFLN